MAAQTLQGSKVVFWMIASAAIAAGIFSWYSSSVMYDLRVDPKLFFKNDVPEEFKKVRAFQIPGARVFEGWIENSSVEALLALSDEDLSTFYGEQDPHQLLEALRLIVLNGQTQSLPPALRYMAAQFDARRARNRKSEQNEANVLALFSTRTNDHHALMIIDSRTIALLTKTARHFPINEFNEVKFIFDRDLSS